MSIERFRHAQNSAVAGFEAALEELRAGGKRSHWMWYVFPQLAGLGRSEAARYFGIQDAAEAEAFLRDDELRSRFLRIVSVVAEQLQQADGPPLHTLMGSRIDAAKLVSSLTLFHHIARSLHAREPRDYYQTVARLSGEILSHAEQEGYPPCAFTLRRLAE